MEDEKHEVWRDGFLFVGNLVALDFVNTRPRIDGEFVELLPDLEALIRWFVAAGLIDAKDGARLRREWSSDRNATRTLDSLREFRERLRGDLIAWEEGKEVRRGTLQLLDDLLARHPMRKRLIAREGQITSEAWFPVDSPEDLYAPIVQSAAQLFTEVDRSRVRKCSNCVLHFVDSSKKGNRHWCSMQLCGNRAKVAAYTARKRQRK